MTATHNPQRYFGPSSVSGNVQTQRYTHTHTSLQTPNLSTCLLRFPPAQRSQLSLPLLIDVGMRPGTQENPALLGGCWRKPAHHGSRAGDLFLMRYLAKSTMVAAVIPSAGGFRSGGRWLRKIQSLPVRKTSCSLFHPGV